MAANLNPLVTGSSPVGPTISIAQEWTAGFARGLCRVNTTTPTKPCALEHSKRELAVARVSFREAHLSGRTEQRSLDSVRERRPGSYGRWSQPLYSWSKFKFLGASATDRPVVGMSVPTISTSALFIQTSPGPSRRTPRKMPVAPCGTSKTTS